MARGLTISEARKFTGKSESTIKRLVREIVADPAHSDRDLIDPSQEEVDRCNSVGERYVWTISEDLLLRRYPDTEKQPVKIVESSTELHEDTVVGILREQLHSKDDRLRVLEQQLDRKDSQIADLSERQRETNILMKTMQERLVIEPPKKPLPLLSRWFKK